MKKILPIFLFAVLPLCSFAFSRVASAALYAALAEIESGNHDHRSGPGGEVSRYQITRSNWLRYAGRLDPRNPFSALNCARVIMRERVGRFVVSHERHPTAVEWYLLWHRPARVDHPRPAELARARHFANLLQRNVDKEIIPIFKTPLSK